MTSPFAKSPLLIALILGSGAAGVLPVAAATWTLVPEASTLTFEGIQVGTPFTGQFGFTAAITLEPVNTEGASIEVVIDTNSFTSGASDRDAASKEADWFDVANYPQATFVSTQVNHLGGNDYVAIGLLTIKGVEKPIELPFTAMVDGDAAVVDGGIDLNRTDFGVGVGDWIDEIFIAHAVRVGFHLEAVRGQ